MAVPVATVPKDKPVMALVLEIGPVTAKVPPSVCEKLAVVAAAPPRMIGALTVLVLVLELIIAPDKPVPVLVRVRENGPGAVERL